MGMGMGIGWGQDWPTIAAGCALACWCGYLSAVDLRSRRLPNAATVPGAVVVLLAAAVTGHGRAALVGAALLSGLYLLTHLAAPAAMGGGDVKLAVGLGGVTGAAGAQTWLLAAVGAVALTAAFGVVLLAAGRRGRSLPHGPSMCLATVVALTATALG
ncbi:prepilin peptidase [Rhodococcus kronopolitis]|uniref:Prepilin peptidase n=1 Tax=Rhodococcus kronopolitis TaxID=1460226 RepID=A0ABV9FPA6_9NOCA